jgi:hypothetical protein
MSFGEGVRGTFTDVRDPAKWLKVPYCLLTSFVFKYRTIAVSCTNSIPLPNIMETAQTTYRVSGHESFACRYAWLPKVAHYVITNPRLFADEARAMVDLGVGKNMVRSARFWSFAAGIIDAEPKGRRHSLTQFALTIFGENGFDPYLEDVRTLWLIHWQLATNTVAPLLAWDYLINKWQEPDITQRTAADALAREAKKMGNSLSATTISQHVEVFFRSYLPTLSRKGEILEDNLDCPLVELQFITQAGERFAPHGGRSEMLYVFNREPKLDITPELFLYALNAFWNARHSGETSLSLREVAHGHGSPGQVFKLPEDDVRDRLDELNRNNRRNFSYADSVNVQQVCRAITPNDHELLRRVYRP